MTPRWSISSSSWPATRISVEVIRDVCADEIAEVHQARCRARASLPVQASWSATPAGTAFAWYGMNPYPRLKRVVLGKLAAGGKKAEKGVRAACQQGPRLTSHGRLLGCNRGRAKRSCGLGA